MDVSIKRKKILFQISELLQSEGNALKVNVLTRSGLNFEKMPNENMHPSHKSFWKITYGNINEDKIAGMMEISDFKFTVKLIFPNKEVKVIDSYVMHSGEGDISPTMTEFYINFAKEAIIAYTNVINYGVKEFNEIMKTNKEPVKTGYDLKIM